MADDADESLAGTTLIVLTGRGARARELRLPRRWSAWLAVLALSSLGASLLVGRTARAWVGPPSSLSPLTASQIAYGEGTRFSAVYIPMTKLPFEPEPIDEPSTSAKPRHAPEAFAPPPDIASVTLRLFDVNAKQVISVKPFATAGAPDDEEFRRLKSFMRCRRTGGEHDMDPRLIALLVRISQHFGEATLHVISAHRVADNLVTKPTSQHTLGTAADIRIPGVSLDALESTAKALGAKGVGVYPFHRFVHVDVRERPYYWRDAPAMDLDSAAGEP